MTRARAPTRIAAKPAHCNPPGRAGPTPGIQGPAFAVATRTTRVLQRSHTPPTAPHVAPPIVHEVLRAPGTPLDGATRESIEACLGHDLGGVRVHAGERAAASARAVNAIAYTVGTSVVFDRGRYAPSSPEGRMLLAHELVHTVQ